MNIIKAVSDKQSLKLENGTSLKCLTQSLEMFWVWVLGQKTLNQKKR
ncbi:MAG: hypothetical protein Ct9H300mP23_11320 [Nitrospinota bacterium]|nr:MAG: hypothetical protein Ct9H300mP23_11320 [Nitrospinota bacterium]